MAEPLAKTFDFLTTTGNVNAVDVLIYALSSPDEPIRERAGIALLRRAATRGQIEVIKRFDGLPARVRSMLLEQQPGRLTAALRHCLLYGDDALRNSARDLVLEGEYYDQVPSLLEMIESGQEHLYELGRMLLGELTDRLFEHVHGGKEARRAAAEGEPARKPLKNAAKVGMGVLAALEGALQRFGRLKHPDEVVEAALVLGAVDHESARKLLTQAATECRELAGRLLMSSRRPGVMQLVLDLMSRNYPPPRAFQVLQERTDPEFIAHLLGRFPKNLGETSLKNFRQVESVAWLKPGSAILPAIPPGLHDPLVSFVAAIGIPHQEKTIVYQWVIHNGSTEGRLAAAEVLTVLDDRAVKKALYSSLQSNDEDAQVWATSQLRARGVPEALRLLIERLDSPHESVRNVAREELHSFNLDLMLNLYEHLDPGLCLRAGQLVRKIDTECIPKLRQEFTSPIARRRMRAARASLALGLDHDVLAELLELARDDDSLVRRTAAEVLAAIEAPQALQALNELKDDQNPRVREEAAKGLAERLAGGARDDAPAVPAGE